jgi:uncharacterized alkaline shock family protein YloU
VGWFTLTLLLGGWDEGKEKGKRRKGKGAKEKGFSRFTFHFLLFTIFMKDLAISPDVLFGIAQLALEPIKGIAPTTPPVSVGEFLTGKRAKGIKVERHSDTVRLLLNVRVTYGLSIPKVVKQAQKAVREAVTSMTGLEVASVDVTVEAIDVPEQMEQHG